MKYLATNPAFVRAIFLVTTVAAVLVLTIEGHGPSDGARQHADRLWRGRLDRRPPKSCTVGRETPSSSAMSLLWAPSAAR